MQYVAAEVYWVFHKAISKILGGQMFHINMGVWTYVLCMHMDSTEKQRFCQANMNQDKMKVEVLQVLKFQVFPNKCGWVGPIYDES